MKKKICHILPVLLLVLTFSVSTVAQTIAEKYNFNFKSEGEEQRWSWIKSQIGCFSYIDSVATKENYKISYTPPSSKNKNMIFIASCTIIIPEQIKGDICQVSIQSKTRNISNAWFMVTALNNNETVISSDDKRLEHSEWTNNELSLNLKNGKHNNRIEELLDSAGLKECIISEENYVPKKANAKKWLNMQRKKAYEFLKGNI